MSDTAGTRKYLKTVGVCLLLLSIAVAVYCLVNFSHETIIKENTYWNTFSAEEVFSYLGLGLAAISILSGCFLHAILIGLATVLRLLEHQANGRTKLSDDRVSAKRSDHKIDALTKKPEEPEKFQICHECGAQMPNHYKVCRDCNADL